MLFSAIILVILNNYYVGLNAERSLPSYKKDFGGFRENGDINDEMTRWFIDTKTNKCKIFYYIGAQGNFNNFRTELECQKHLENPIADKIKGCQDTPQQAGVCNASLGTGSSRKRWSWYQTTATCEEFQYSGCGGNRNRYDSLKECEYICYNNNSHYGNPSVQLNDSNKVTENQIPNYFDCHLRPDLDIPYAEIKAMALIGEKQCIHVAVGTYMPNKVIRGTFDDITSCIKKCFPYEHDLAETNSETQMMQKIPACSRVQPDQFEKPSDTPTAKPEIRFYHDKSTDSCKRFESWPGPFDIIKNNFPSAEICESYCGSVETEEENEVYNPHSCILPKAGEYSETDNTNGNLKVKRWYFDSSETALKCYSFLFGGINGNSNNFKSSNACISVCFRNMDPEETLFSISSAEDPYITSGDDTQPIS